VNIFSSSRLLPSIQKSLQALGFTKPTEIQEIVIPMLLDNPKNDMHAQAQTGTGKTLAFGIPLLHIVKPEIKDVQALVIAPTRELVLQIYESLRDISRETNIIIEPVYGGMPIGKQISNIRRGAQVIIGTPGRLIDHLERKTLSLKSLKVLVLDEADIMLDMGFKEDIDNILTSAPKDRQIWLFSATVRPGIKQLIKSHMKNVLTAKASEKGITSVQVKQYYCIAPMRNRVEATARFIESAPDFYGIIFCRTKMLAGEVMEQLIARGFKANSLHGDMNQPLRNKVIRGFKNKDFNILTATDVAARGIDVSDLSHVINFSTPEELESYVHRIGRTGRAGKEGIAITFVTPNEIRSIKRIEKLAQTNLLEIPIPPIDTIINSKMAAVSDFIEQSKEPNKKLSEVHKVVMELVSSFTENEVKNALAAALEDKFFKDIINENLSSVSSASSDNIPQEIFFGLGHENGFTEDMIRDYLYRTCKLVPQDLRKVRVLKQQTYISIPENRLKNCVDAMKASPIANIPHKIFLVKDTYGQPKQDSSNRHSDRFGGNRNRSKRRDQNRKKRY